MKPYRTGGWVTLHRPVAKTCWFRIARPHVLLFLMVLTAGLCHGCSSYQKLSDDYLAYRPPMLAAVPERPVTDSGKGSPPADDFMDQQHRIESTAMAWTSALNPEDKDIRFFSPAPENLSALTPAAHDEAAAVRALSPNFSLETVQILTLLRNSGILSAEKVFQGKLQAYSQVTGLDDMLRQYAALTRSVMPGIGNMADKASPAALFPFPGILALKGEIVTQEIIISRQALEITRKAAISESRRLYWNLAANTRVQEITRTAAAILDQLEVSVRKRYETGQETLQAVLRVQIQQIRLAEELTTLREERKTLLVGIRSLLDLDPSSVVGNPEVRQPPRESPNLEGISALAIENSQELKTGRAMIGRMERMIEMAESEIYPPFTQNYSLFQNRSVSQVGTGGSEIPFGTDYKAYEGEGIPKNRWFGLEDAYLRETRENLTALRQELKKTENELRFKAREGWFRLDRSIREERIYTKKIKEFSRLASEITANRYEAGTADLRDVIDYYMLWFDTLQTAEQKKADIGIARADLEEIVGISFQ